ncbi:MAG: acyl carrier protein [Treponema sp.]|nr:acyl carrier protein [Treponema sp.]
MTKDELFTRLKDILINDFEADESLVVPRAHLVDDLGLDSIDFIDLVVKTKEFIPGKIDPELFKTVRTVQDAVDALQPYTEQA